MLLEVSYCSGAPLARESAALLLCWRSWGAGGHRQGSTAVACGSSSSSGSLPVRAGGHLGCTSPAGAAIAPSRGRIRTTSCSSSGRAGRGGRH